MGITEKIFSLDQMPQRIGFDFHTRSELTFRSFEHKAHKVFFTIDEDSETVNIVAVLPSRTKYSAKL
jgi:plasmid stabilization system protein ParE